jgi:HK97 gp10 family phage protein
VTYRTEIPQAVQEMDRTADRLVRKFAFDILGKAQRRAPYRTGNLRTSGTVHTVGMMSAEITFTANYAAFVELGTRKMAARPFLGPAFTETVPAIMDAFKMAVKVLGS